MPQPLGIDEELATIAKTMGFPREAWFEDAPGDGIQTAPTEGRDLAERVGYLFDTIVNPGTGEPYTNAGVARMSVGGLTEEGEGMRPGAIPDPTVGQVAALAAVFGVDPSYLTGSKEPPTLDAELIEGLRDETTRQISCEALHLPEHEREIVLGIVRQFGEAP